MNQNVQNYMKPDLCHLYLSLSFLPPFCLNSFQDFVFKSKTKGSFSLTHTSISYA